jgi:hypothetical protein
MLISKIEKPLPFRKLYGEEIIDKRTLDYNRCYARQEEGLWWNVLER